MGELDSARHEGARPGPVEPVQVIVLAIDGVRLKEVFEGIDAKLADEQHLRSGPASAADLMPNLHRLASTRGTLFGGPNEDNPMWASGPNFVSLPGYRELLTGQAPVDCQKNECSPVEMDTLADDFRSASANAGDVAVVTSWEGIENTVARKPETIVSSCGRERGTNRELLATDAESAALLRAGEEAGPEPGTGEFRPDELTSRIALRYLARERPRFLFVGLGETDEYAHRGDYAGYLHSLHAADRVLGAIDALLENSGAWQRDALVFVTTDHGRGNNFRDHGGNLPESGRVWLLALGRRVRSRGSVPSWRTHHLADIAPTIRVLSGLSPDPSGRGGAPFPSLIAASSNYPLIK